MSIRDTDIAYTAGFFDGEGSVTVSYDKYLRVEVCISQKHLTPLAWIRKVFGGTIYQSEGYAYQWKVNGARAITFLYTIKEYLIEKAVDVEEAISIWVVRDDPLEIRRLIAERRERRARNTDRTSI